ncbi:MAG: FAD-dependent thymidylate synthase [Patescibacteria group bacterium]
MQERFSDIWELREWIKTKPSENLIEETKFYRGVEGIVVDLIDWPTNPYKALFSMVTSTWGNVQNMKRWENSSPKARLYVINAVLNRKCLPNAMESISFTFDISGPSRSAFDQIARARIGAVFSSMGWRDNAHGDIGFRVPEAIYANEDRRRKFIEGRLLDKKDYIEEITTDQSNWQDARAVLPISACHRWSMSMNYMALSNFMSKRLMFNEQADTVATAWLMRERIKEKFPLLASYLRPASDHARRCLEHVGDEVAQAFGCLFKCSGRWPCTLDDDKYTFNTACSDRETIMNQLGIYIPEGPEDLYDTNITIDKISEKDSVFISC